MKRKEEERKKKERGKTVLMALLSKLEKPKKKCLFLRSHSGKLVSYYHVVPSSGDTG